MSPIRSTIGRSVGKFLGSFRNRDLTLSSSVRTSRIPPFTVTGGTKTTYGSYVVHTFLSSGTFEVQNAPPSFSCDVLVVGGGGCGGSGYSGVYEAGGGGAGGFRESPAHPIIGTQSISVIVGNGGGASVTNPDPAQFGGYSEFVEPGNPIRSEGGGAGGAGYINPGGYGASAGGNRRSGVTPTATAANRVAGYSDASPSPAFSPQGYGGGDGYNSGADSGGGGGGGAGAVGGAGGANVGGNGGIGRQNNYRTGSNVYYAGGGGGVGFSAGPGTGGSGGGGNGSNSGTAPSGTINTGGGGGAGDSDSTGGNGGSGIVVVRYLA